MVNPVDLSLYLVLDAEACRTRENLLRMSEEALAAGITVLQLRSHHRDWHKRLWYETALALKRLCAAHRVPLIINDEVDVALAVDADGVHIGQSDLPPLVVRRLVGAGKIIGLSTSSVAQVKKANALSVDYIGMGPVYPTGSKTDADPPIGLDILGQMVAEKTMPGVAIGGIGTDNVQAVRKLGPEGIAVISAICNAPDIATAVSQLLQGRRVRPASRSPFHHGR